MSKVCTFLNTLFRIVWGFIYDALGFKIPYTIVTSTQIVVSATFYFSVKYLWRLGKNINKEKLNFLKWHYLKL